MRALLGVPTLITSPFTPTPFTHTHPSAQDLLKQLRGHLQQEEAKRDATKAELDKVTRLMLNAKVGVEHLASKVQHIKLVSPGGPGQTLRSHCQPCPAPRPCATVGCKAQKAPAFPPHRPQLSS